MKNLPFIIGAVLIVVGVLFVLVTSGKQNTNSTSTATDSSQKKEASKVTSKTYSSAPAVLAETDRIGKKVHFVTNLGEFTITLFGDKTPKTVSNFITLARDGFYNNLVFHRIIANFMIQGGDPLGNGTGGPGYQFSDEFDPSLTFAKPGMLAMANSGPNTNGSQFFITVSTPTYLNNKHTIFGEVSQGMDVVEKISKVATDKSDKPTDSVIIKILEII